MDSCIKLPAVGKVDDLTAKTWDHRGRTGIRQIFVSYGSAGVHALRFQYVIWSIISGSSSAVLSQVFGTIRLTDFQTVQLDYPREHLTSVTIYKSSDQFCGIGGIAFTTDMGKSHGPFPSNPTGSPVRYHIGDGNQFGGFHGNATETALTSIGDEDIPVRRYGESDSESNEYGSGNDI
ncbi:unnamed protein product [Rhodiola kirilowii]